MRLSRTITAPTASRGHVERVATSCEILIKYSSHEGRTFLRASCSREVSTAGPGRDGGAAEDPGPPPPLDLFSVRRRPPAGSEHGVEDEHEVLLEVPGQ